MPKEIACVHWPDAPDLWMPFSPAMEGRTAIYLADVTAVTVYRHHPHRPEELDRMPADMSGRARGAWKFETRPRRRRCQLRRRPGSPVLTAQEYSKSLMACRSRRTAFAAGIALAMGAAAPSESYAGAFGVREQSAVGEGMAFAGEGSPSMGLSAMFWNPAAVTQTEDAQVETHLTGVFPQISIETLPGTSAQLMSLGNSSVSIGQRALLGAFYAGYNYDQHLYFGIATGTPFGLRTSAALPWPGQNLSLQAHAKSFEGNPIVGYRVNGMLSVAAGVRVIWVQTGFSRAILPSVQNPSVAELNASDVALGWNLGATLTPWTGAELALGYRSAIDVSLGGRTVLPPVAPLSGVFGVSGRATLPDQVNLGIRQRLGPSLTLLGTVEWTNWSRIQNVPFTFTNGPATSVTATTLTLNYRNGWYFAVGGEYQWSAETTLRAGVGYEVSPVTSGVRDPALPYNDGWRLSVGMTHQFSPSITLDVGYSYIVVKDAPIKVVPGHPDFADLLGSSFVAVGKQRDSIVSLALRYKFRT